MPEPATLTQQAEAVASWAEKQAAPSNTPRYDRLTSTDLGLLLKYRKDGLTQVEIAQRLGCTQSTVSKWLDNLTDTRDTASEYLRGQSLRMAKNIVQSGQARDHVKTLEGLGVLQAQDNTGLTLVINGLTLHGTNRDQAIAGEVLSPPSVPALGEGVQNP